MRESTIEAYLNKRVKAAGGIAYKFVSPARRNVPDRICVFPDGRIAFVECKRPGERPTAGQQREIERLRELKCNVWVVDSLARVDAFMYAMNGVWK